MSLDDSSRSARGQRAAPRWTWTALLSVAALGGAACSGPGAVAPSAQAGSDLARGYLAAMDAEAADATSAGPYLDVIDRAAAEPAAKGALAAVVASVDALVTRTTPGLEEIDRQSVVFRARPSMPEVVARLRAAWNTADPSAWTEQPRSPADASGQGSRAVDAADAAIFVRGTIARGLHELALFSGDAPAAAAWAERRGCITGATVIGPIDWTPLKGLEEPSPVTADAPLAAAYRGVAPFAAKVAPVVVRADACQLDVSTTSLLQGLRAVVVDLEIPRAQRIGLALTSSSAAVVDVGGVRAIRRGFEAGGRQVTRLSAVDVPAGRVRVVVRVAQKGDGTTIELGAWGEDGLPLSTRPAWIGDVAAARVKTARPVEIEPGGEDDASMALAAAGLLGLGEARVAEHLLEQPAAKNRAVGLELLYARAIDQAGDLPDVKAIERTRAASERILAARPASWEGRILRVRLTERRRGFGEGTVEALKSLGVVPPIDRAARAPHAGEAQPATPGGRSDETRATEDKALDHDAMALTFIALAASRVGMVDIAEDAYRRLALAAPDSALLAALDARLHRRVGAAQVRAACEGGLSRASTVCLDAYIAQADLRSILAEIARLRRLRGAPEALQAVELSQRMAHGDLAGALAVYDAMPPSERSILSAPALAAGRGKLDIARSRFDRDGISARDTPYAIGPLLRALDPRSDPAPALEAEGMKLVAKDRAAAFLPGAGTAVLRHAERYTIEPSGLVHYTNYDLRRVSSTTDVEQGAQSYGARVEGRGAPRLLRRRIHKKDGRVLEPDATPAAAQSHSDLSQLEQGDYVEQIVEGWALPGDSGQMVIDTPDMLPERTSVREAEIVVRRPASIPFAVWAHPLLGTPEERTEGGFKTSVWRLKDRAPRRIEDGVPRMERGVSVSIGTQTWAAVARAVDENIRAMEDRDPMVTRWAMEAAGADRAPSRALVDRIVAAAGKTVKVAQGGELSDSAALFSGGAQSTTARTTLELGQGSRSWVIYRALRELGVSTDLAIAEVEPFSESADFPAHAGRFRHPLVIARLGAAGGGDLWIDADVEGPPLPPGRISPELRGRSALLASGQIVTVEGTSGETGDEVDVRLVLDEKGDARGTFTVLLHGRTAQALSESFETVVGTERREILRGVVLGWLPWADVEDVSLSSTQGSWEVSLRAAITIHGYGRPEGSDGKTWVLPGLEPVHFVFPRAFVGTLGATYASRGSRQSALSIDSALQYHVHRRVELPAGATVTRPAAAVSVKDARIEAIRKGTIKGQVIEEDFTFSLPTGTVTAGDYQRFVEKVHVIDDGFMSGARVKVKP